MTYLRPQDTGLSFAVRVTPRGACPQDVRVRATNPPWGTNPEGVYGPRPLALLEGQDWLSARQKADLAAWVALNIETLVEFWEGRIFGDLDLRKRLRGIGHARPCDFRLACVVLRALAPKVRSIAWSAGAYHLTFARRMPDGRRLAQRFARLGFMQGITTSVAKPASVREQFPIGGEFRCGGKRCRCTDVGTRVIPPSALTTTPTTVGSTGRPMPLPKRCSTSTTILLANRSSVCGRVPSGPDPTAPMLLSITTTHCPATDLGYLLAKHPDRLQSFALSFGEAHVVYPEASDDRCTAALILDLDPVALVRGRPAGPGDDGSAGPLAQYVNDRPYVASSFLSVAIGKVLGSALGGRGPRPDLAASALPFSATVGPVRVRGGTAVVERLFRPLGYGITVEPVANPDGTSPVLWMLTLSATTRLQALLSHIYVLAPVLDDDKHYWVSEDEIDKLLRHGEGWLSDHPDREFIARRYLRRGPRLARQAIDRLATLDAEAPPPDAGPDRTACQVQEPPRLNDLRHQAVLRVLQECGAATVLDLGCGEGRLLRLLLGDSRFSRVVGVDISTQALDTARERLGLDRMPDRQRERLALLQSALTYRDRRLSGFDAAALVEVVEHVDPGRLPAFARAVFGHARPGTVVLTTPNRDWNATVPVLARGALRHRDHRFEWDRAEFAAWAAQVAADFGYRAELNGIGEPHPELGCPTQMAVFRCG